jgi:nicotinamide/nicotinate riboside kinase
VGTLCAVNLFNHLIATKRILLRYVQNGFTISPPHFAKPIELIPIHPVHGVQDWDSAPGAIDWVRFAAFLRHVKTAGVIPPEHRSHDHLNKQKNMPVDQDVVDKWTTTFKNVEEESQRNGEKLVWGLVDGFLLYWDRVGEKNTFSLFNLTIPVHYQDVIDQLDVRLFLRVPHDVLHRRRHERDGYYTAGRESIRLLF